MVEVLRSCWILDVLKIEVTALDGWIRRVKCGSKVFVLHSPKRVLPYSEKKEVAGGITLWSQTAQFGYRV